MSGYPVLRINRKSKDTLYQSKLAESMGHLEKGKEDEEFFQDSSSDEETKYIPGDDT